MLAENIYFLIVPGYVAAFALLLTEIVFRRTGIVLPLISAFVFLCVTAAGLLMGMTLEELLVVTLVFFVATLFTRTGSGRETPDAGGDPAGPEAGPGKSGSDDAGRKDA